MPGSEAAGARESIDWLSCHVVLEPRSTEVPLGFFQIVGGLGAEWAGFLLSPSYPHFTQTICPLSSIYILKFQGKICLRKISAAKQKFKNTWPTLTYSFLSKCAIERASTLLKVAQ